VILDIPLTRVVLLNAILAQLELMQRTLAQALVKNAQQDSTQEKLLPNVMFVHQELTQKLAQQIALTVKKGPMPETLVLRAAKNANQEPTLKRLLLQVALAAQEGPMPKILTLIIVTIAKQEPSTLKMVNLYASLAQQEPIQM